jgi:hypothetical protein
LLEQREEFPFSQIIPRYTHIKTPFKSFQKTDEGSEAAHACMLKGSAAYRSASHEKARPKA